MASADDRWVASGLLALVLLGLEAPAWASAPFNVDDANIVPPGSAQLEAYSRMGIHGFEVWMLPATQPWHNWELTLGGDIIQRQQTALMGQDMVVQTKTLFKPLAKNTWGLGLVMGGNLSLNLPGGIPLGGMYVYFPLSFSFDNDRLLLHQNLGWRYDRTQASPQALTWGVASELTLSQRWTVEAELAGDTTTLPSLQIGPRYSFVPEHVQGCITFLQPLGEGLDASRITVMMGLYQ